MLEHTFCHIPRVGVATEQRYWDKGLKHWDDVLGPGGESLGTKTTWVRDQLELSRQHLAQGNARWFDSNLPSQQGWRLFGAFREGAAYVDIETTGLGMDEDHITTIALYGGGRVRTYVHGRNLEDFQDDIRDFNLLVTFNGKCFDVPFIERSFGIKLDMAHIDLRFVLKKIGFTGGLKAIEKQLGVARDDLDGVDGYFAVLLWNEFQTTGDPAALETLLAYNAADVVGLEPLMVHAWNELIRETPFAGAQTLPEPRLFPVPNTPDVDLVQRLKRRYGLF